MSFPDIALLVNLLGFVLGVALYGMIAAMVVRHRVAGSFKSVDLLLMVTALLGLIWNLGELYASIQKDFTPGPISPWIVALAYSALGFLPSVVVYSTTGNDRRTKVFKLAFIGLSTIAAILHFGSAAGDGSVPSSTALYALSFGSVGLAVALFVLHFRERLEANAVWIVALIVFALSALHLGSTRESSQWYIELASHQSSLLLALTILYQNYRFAFADVFLRRAISLLAISLVAAAEYLLIAVPLLGSHESHTGGDEQVAAIIIAMAVATALVYPLIRRMSAWLVDSVILRRADYALFLSDLARDIEPIESIDAVLDEVSERVADVLTARRRAWLSTDDVSATVDLNRVELGSASATIGVPTAEMPAMRIEIGDFAGGRRLLSDEIAMLDGAALLTARRVDALRRVHERCEREFREEEFARLASEAQLMALRAQINPHFLFNALTTIGYLIKAEPDKAYDTLLRLTKLLRGVLSSSNEFCTLGEEIALIRSYLDIERARFEEKLEVEFAVPDELERVRVPALILQPLVENAVKHGVSASRDGGRVKITAELGDSGDRLRLSVWNSATAESDFESSAGVGLQNVRSRLANYFGDSATLELLSSVGLGTTARIEFVPENL